MAYSEHPDDRFKSRDPSQIDPEILEDLICRFLLHLPPSEKQFPRIFFNIREACYFYVDNYLPISPKLTNDYEKKFARAVFEQWPYLA